MKKLNILGMATLIAANATSQELIKTKPKLDKKDEMASVTKKENKSSKNTKKTETKKNTTEKNSYKKKKVRTKRKRKHRTRQEILSGIDFIDVTQFFQNDEENKKFEKRAKSNRKVTSLPKEDSLASNPDLIAIDKNFKNEKVKNMSENTDKQDKLQKQLDKKILKDKLKEMKKKKAALKRRIKIMDRDFKNDNTFITEEIYVQNKKNENKKVISVKTEKNSQNDEKNLDADTLNIINFSSN